MGEPSSMKPSMKNSSLTLNWKITTVEACQATQNVLYSFKLHVRNFILQIEFCFPQR